MIRLELLSALSVPLSVSEARPKHCCARCSSGVFTPCGHHRHPPGWLRGKSARDGPQKRKDILSILGGGFSAFSHSDHEWPVGTVEDHWQNLAQTPLLNQYWVSFLFPIGSLVLTLGPKDLLTWGYGWLCLFLRGPPKCWLDQPCTTLKPLDTIV